jgi:hypothetical protein
LLEAVGNGKVILVGGGADPALVFVDDLLLLLDFLVDSSGINSH